MRLKNRSNVRKAKLFVYDQTHSMMLVHWLFRPLGKDTAMNDGRSGYLALVTIQIRARMPISISKNFCRARLVEYSGKPNTTKNLP